MASSSDMDGDDDEDDDTPLAMLPASTSAAKHTAPSAEQTPAGPVRQLPQLTNPASTDIPDALPASSSTFGEQSDTPAARQSVQVKTALFPSMQEAAGRATNAATITPHRGDIGPLDAAERIEDATAVPSATALPSAEARQAVQSSLAQVKGDITQGRHNPHQPAVSMQERQANMVSGLQAVPDPSTSAEAGIVDNPQLTNHQDQLISDSQPEGSPGLSSQGPPCPAEGMPASVTDTAAPVHSSAIATLQAAGDAAFTHTAHNTQQKKKQSYSNPGDGSPVVNSSTSLLQAEEEAARLAVLLAPPVYRPPARAHQLASMGTEAPVREISISRTQAPLQAQSGSTQAAILAADKALLARVQSQACNSGTAEVDSPETVQRQYSTARGLPTSTGSAQLPGQSRQATIQHEDAEVTASSGLQQLGMQVNQQRLKNGGGLEAAHDGQAPSSKQGRAPDIHEEDAADVVIPDR